MFQHSELTPRPGRIHWVSASSKKGPTTCLHACVLLHSKLLLEKNVQWSLGSVSPCTRQWVLQNKRTLLSELETVVSCSASIPGNHVPVFSGAAPSPQPPTVHVVCMGLTPHVYTLLSPGVSGWSWPREWVFSISLARAISSGIRNETQSSKRDSIQGRLLEPLERRSTLAKRML